MSYPSPDTCLTLEKGMHTVVCLFSFWNWDSGIFEWCGGMCPHLGTCFYMAAAFEKHLNRLKQTCAALLSLSPLLGSTEPQNFKTCGHGLGTPALLSLAQRELCVTWNCPQESGTVGILIPKQMSCWETRALEVKTSWRQWINIFPWKSVLSEFWWWALLQTKLWVLSRGVPSRQVVKGRWDEGKDGFRGLSPLPEPCLWPQSKAELPSAPGPALCTPDLPSTEEMKLKNSHLWQNNSTESFFLAFFFSPTHTQPLFSPIFSPFCVLAEFLCLTSAFVLLEGIIQPWNNHSFQHIPICVSSLKSFSNLQEWILNLYWISLLA